MFPLNLLLGGIPFKAIFGFILTYWKELMVVSMLAIIIYQNTFETRWVFFVNTIPYLENQLEEYVIAVDKAEKANLLLTNTIKKRNDQIAQWKEKSVELEKKNAELTGQLELLRSMTVAEVDQILSDPTPESCEASIDYLRTGIPDLHFIHRGAPTQ